jgi:tripartite-type tricarboxylate transporter receptor subunit TctC
MPALPTMIEAGVPDFEAVVWQGLSAPAGTPRPIVDRLNASVRRILQVPDVVAHFENFGAERAGGTPEDFDALVRRQLHVWADVVKRSGQGK